MATQFATGSTAAFKLEIITDRFNQMLADLAAIDPRIDFRNVVIAVATRVVQGAANRTRMAKTSAIRRNYLAKEWTTINGERVNLAWKMSDAKWSAISMIRAEHLKSRLAAVGLAKRSWAFLASLLQANLDLPMAAQTANYRGHIYPQDVAKSEEGSANDYALTILNTSPIVQAAGGYGALLGAMAGEVGYFRNNMRHAFYLTAARRAAKYPGIFVQENAA